MAPAHSAQANGGTEARRQPRASRPAAIRHPQRRRRLWSRHRRFAQSSVGVLPYRPASSVREAANTAHAALELYAQAFEDAGALDRLEAFASHFGPDFYGLPRNTDTVTLVKQDWQVPDSYPLGNSTLVPLFAGETMHWKLKQ